MKKYFIFISLFFLFLSALVIIPSYPQAAGETCGVTPAQINTDGTTYARATLITEDYGATAPTWYAKLVRELPNGTFYSFEEENASRQFGDGDPNHDYFVANFGPFNAGDEGNYTVYFDTSADVGRNNFQAACSFAVQSIAPPPGIACPSFISLEPPEEVITSNSDIELRYNKNTASAINEYQVEIFDDNNVRIKTVALSENGSIWLANVGNLPGPEEVYSAKLTYKGVSPPHVCNSTNISVLDSRDSTFGSGQNPCVGNVCRTALGDIPTDITGFAGRVLSIAIGLAGGIALILMVFGSIRVLTSSGDQQRLSAGRDTIIAAIAGLLFLIFSVLILRALGIVIGITFP